MCWKLHISLSGLGRGGVNAAQWTLLSIQSNQKSRILEKIICICWKWENKNFSICQREMFSCCIRLRREINPQYSPLVRKPTSGRWTGDWSIDLLIDWLVDWLVDALIDWLMHWLIDWCIDWLIDWLVLFWLCVWLFDWLIEYFIDKIFVCLFNYLISWFIDWCIYWWIDWFIAILIYSFYNLLWQLI